jgi:hypothetical protein
MAKGMTGKRLPQAAKRDALEVTAELLARRVSNAKIKKALSSRFGVSARTGDRYIAEVLKGWSTEDDERSTYRRTQARRSLEGIIESALLGDERWVGKDDQGRPVYRRVPDRKAAVAASRLLARVDGILDSEERSAVSKMLDSVLEGLADGIRDDVELDLPESDDGDL